MYLLSANKNLCYQNLNMAQMIPDRLPTRASAGEKKLFSVLQKLGDDCIVYYEPIVEDRYPDFIVISPDMGLLVIEVKGWYPRDIRAGDLNSICVKEAHGEVYRNHPVRQARDYMYSLMDKCREHYHGKRLLQKEGKHQNKFIFPFGHFAVLSNITQSQLQQHDVGDLTEVFPSNKVVPRDVLESWMDDSFSCEDLCEVIKTFFNPYWDFPRLNQSQINAIRAIIHPEIVISPVRKNAISPQKQDKNSVPKPSSPETSKDFEPVDLKVLDLRQEDNARKIGEGHRIIYGVAGSGKTILLIAKARLLSHQRPDAKILLLCYNVTLATYLREILRECPNVNVRHFDGWSKANGCTRQNKESNEKIGDRFLSKLENGCPDTRYYDAVLIDEAQDFAVSWFKCVLEAMQEPNDGDLVIVGDGSQGLYGSTKVSWKKIGINARGRTISAKFDLDKNYRNSREIVELAAVFAGNPDNKEQTEDSILSLFVDPAKCQRPTGIRPALVTSEDRRSESTKVMGIVKALLDGKWFGKSIKPLKPEEIAILYPMAPQKERAILKDLIQGLGQLAPVVWLNKDSFARTLVAEPGIKIQTVHSAKGLQYRAVILMWADQLPRPFENINEAEERCLMYVGVTRPEDYLVISASGFSPFVREIKESGEADLIHERVLSIR
ncbi:nuclease-related domain-containing DEAD/DEAH box helicase [Mastigocoleus testarum]|uniref:Uncharacterized protein n=1 Tax=Mastigocoleus testarum BC008 TaxID=371196 RepID=A0A0V7ZSW0_9CYAN|nr:nuclease-related domain-containing DEAD/DEAH box helicase [Mastigocoleus testarum]KST67286.1 hypothetical protein BC008_29300 [Mastigocoleus testarum BC008]